MLLVKSRLSWKTIDTAKPMIFISESETPIGAYVGAIVSLCQWAMIVFAFKS